MRTATFKIAALLFVTAVAGFAQKGDDQSPEYQLLATKRTGTMQKEIDEAAAQGYRILTGSPTSGDEMALFMQKVATTSAPYQYKLLATTRTGTMDRELNEMAAQGFQLIVSTIIAKKSAMGLGGVEIVALLERAPASEKRYQYKLLATNRTGTLQKEVTDAQTAGFKIVGMVSRGEHMVIMERESAK